MEREGERERERLGVIDEIHKPARVRFPRRRVQIRGLHDLFQADLVDLKSRASSNNGYSYILFVMNTFSKYVWAEPLKTKTGGEVARAMAKILASTTPPRNLQVDDVKESYNSSFLALMKNHGINMYSTYSVLKASLIERVNRTINGVIFKNFTIKGKQNWTRDLQTIVNRYNDTVHRTIGMKPREVTSKDEKRLLRTVYREIKQAGRSKFNVGDQVRVSRYKHLFEKGYTPNWTTETFTIYRKQTPNPRTYLLKDVRGQPIKGGFYAAELQKTKYPGVFLVERVIRRSGNRELVEWLGFDESHNFWIDI